MCNAIDDRECEESASSKIGAMQICSSVRRVRGQIDSNVDAKEIDDYRVDNVCYGL